MTSRFDPEKVAPKAFKAMLGLEKYLYGSDIQNGPIFLLKLQISAL